MSRPVHFEQLPDGQWLAACARCPRRFSSGIDMLKASRHRAPSFSEANDWWKLHRETSLHQAYAGPKVITEEEARLAEIFGEEPVARRGGK